MCVAMKAAMIALLPALWPIRNLTSELPCSPSNASPPAGERGLHYITLPDRGGAPAEPPIEAQSLYREVPSERR